ncbi:MAG: hypothetical protein O7H40_15505 [Gammaproteobacteria bacterium]|nr:hypothetical protein [Gammaproteobacteria bacterium]
MMTAGGNLSKTGLVGRLGILRLLLIMVALVIIAAAPFADGSSPLHDWRLLPSVVAPSIMMMLVFAIPLDITMARIFMADADAAEISRLKFIIRTEIAVYVVLIGAWIPFMVRVLDFSLFSSG